MLSRLLGRRLCSVRYKPNTQKSPKSFSEKFSNYKDYFFHESKTGQACKKLLYIGGWISTPVAIIMALKMIFINDLKSKELDMSGKVVLITGSSSGFGFQLAKSVAQRGGTVILASRSAPNMQAAKKSILSEYPDAKVEIVKLNLASLDSVQKCVQTVLAEFGKVDVLVNNAAIYKPQGKRDPYMTKDGIERTFQVAFLGHYLLSELLKETIISQNGRIVSVLCDSLRKGVISLEKNEKSSSCKNYELHSTLEETVPETLTEEDIEKFKHIESYKQAKLCMYLMMLKWAKEFESDSQTSVSIGVDPGASNDTLFNRYSTTDYGINGALLSPFILYQNLKLPNLENASQTLVSVVCDPEFYGENMNGKILKKHKTKEWEKKIEKAESKKIYFNIIQQPQNIELLDGIAKDWTDLDRRKEEISRIPKKIEKIEKPTEPVIVAQPTVQPELS